MSRRKLTWARIGLVLSLAFLFHCSGPNAGNDAGVAVSFGKDLLTPFPPPSFEGSCGLSTSCHHSPVVNPKTDLVFLGCYQTSATCTATTGDVAEQVYRGLVGTPDAGITVSSQELPSMPYVTPGDPENSYLVHKLEGTLSGLKCSDLSMDSIAANASGQPGPHVPCGYQMPLGGDPLPSFAAKVRAWIMQGAPDN